MGECCSRASACSGWPSSTSGGFPALWGCRPRYWVLPVDGVVGDDVDEPWPRPVAEERQQESRGCRKGRELFFEKLLARGSLEPLRSLQSRGRKGQFFFFRKPEIQSAGGSRRPGCSSLAGNLPTWPGQQLTYCLHSVTQSGRSGAACTWSCPPHLSLQGLGSLATVSLFAALLAFYRGVYLVQVTYAGHLFNANRYKQRRCCVCVVRDARQGLYLTLGVRKEPQQDRRCMPVHKPPPCRLRDRVPWPARPGGIPAVPKSLTSPF